MNIFYRSDNISFHSTKNKTLRLTVLLLTATFFTVSAAGNSYSGMNNDQSENLSLQQTSKRNLTGVIVDKTGEPIIGASISVEGTTEGTITDINGAFNINVASGSILNISYISYISQRIHIASQASLRIVLVEDMQSLEEVVVVGYGTQKRVTITGSVASVSGEDLARIPTSSITNTLIGQTPGLIANNTSGQPGFDDAEILIRGRSTSRDTSPLIVVDGVADRAGGFSRIDPNDIESISILKDASAAIYGSRAANGVILVTTKRGAQSAPKVTFTSNVGFRRPTALPKMVNSAEYAELLNEIQVYIENKDPMYSAEEIQKFRDGSDPYNFPNVDAFGTILKDWSLQTQHNLSLRGGSEKVDYFVSLGYQYSDDYFKKSASNYDQYNFRSNLDIRPFKNLKFSVNLSARKEDREQPTYSSSDIWRYLVKYDPRALIYWPGTDLSAPTVQDSFGASTAVTDVMGYNNNERSYFSGDLSGHFDMPFITPGLSVDAGIYVDRSDTFTKRFQKAFYTYTRNGDGSYSQRHNGPNEANLNQVMDQTLGITMNGRINYKKNFGLHNLDAFVAYEQFNSTYNTMTAYRSNFIGTSLDQLLAGDPNTQTNTGSATETARQNYFGRLDYNFAEKYLLQFNFRYDGSENFPKGKRFGFFPEVSMGWRVSEESFWKENIPSVNYFKLRASWGQMGNDRTAAFQYVETYTMGNNAVFGASSPKPYSGIVSGRAVNPNITWEVAEAYNAGLEMRFLKNFNLELDVYKNKRSNILMSRGAAIPDYAGLSLPDENIGKTESKGFEFLVGYNKKVNDWRFNASANMSFTRSKFIYISEAADVKEWQKRTGKPIDATWLMYESIGIFHSKEDLDKYPHLANAGVGDLMFRDVDGDGSITANDRVRLSKSPTPEIIFGFNLGANYKNWGISALLQGATRVWQYTFWESGTIGTFTKDFYKNRWTKENPNSDFPRVYNREVTATGQKNTFWLHDATYLRLKNIELSYTFDSKTLQSLSISGLKLYVSGYNFLTLTGLKDHDPETREGGQGFAAWNTPQTKVLNFGLQLTF